MADLSYAQLKGTWLTASQGTKYHTNAWASLMAAIAEAESSGDPTATNPTDNNGTQTSWGLWQISLGNHDAPAPNWADPVENARLAIGKLDDQGLSAWGTYDSGAYQAYLSDKTAADLTATPGPDAVTTAALTSSAQADQACAWRLGGLNLHNIGLGPIHGPTTSGICLLSKTNARALIGAGLLVGGILIAGFGVAGLVILSGPAAQAAGLVLGGPEGAVAGAVAAESSAPAAPATPKAQGTLADRRGTSPEFRKQYGLT